MKEFLERISSLSPERVKLLAAQLQGRLDALENQRAEAVAIVGMSCRFPGGADSPESFWELLRGGVDAITEVPPERWKIDEYYDPDPEKPGKMSTRWGGFIKDVDLFDAHFFGIAPREAAGLDPQQRLLLELSWEALERAGQSPERMMDSETGVFVGISGSDYLHLQMETGIENIDAYFASGNAHSIATGRLSYVLGLRGPSIPVDTACSSSLVATHLAVQSLRSGECRMALVGGVNLILTPETTITLSKAHMLASDGRCKAFDARADGFVRSEGGGVILLKRLSDALADGDSILALIRGSAVNQDGRSNGLTAPNGPSQEAVIRAALANGRVHPRQVSYVEAHGTGTSLGDPIEVQAMAAVLGEERAEPLMIGSVKTNLGHLESAAGIAGLIKTVLMLQHEEIPPHLHLREPNPHIPWGELPVSIPTRRSPWQSEGENFAGVSSFGFSGTNAHIVLSSAPPVSPKEVENRRPLHLFALSARSEPALRQLAERCAAQFAREALDVADAAYTAGVGHSHFNHRLAVPVRTADEALEALSVFARGEEPAGLSYGRLQGSRQPRIAFLFTGQGAQYSGMARQLYDTEPVFRGILDRCDLILRAHLDRPLLPVIFAAGETDAALIHETAYTQPALFAVEYALAMLWQSWGIHPSVVMGHSVGEYVAACAAGVFTLEDGLKLIAERARLMQQLPAGGGMAAVFADEATVAQAIAPYSSQLAIAAINGPTNVVISGAGEALGQVLELLHEQGVKSRRLAVSHAFHSPLMDAVLDKFERAAAAVQYAEPQIGLMSNVTGKLAGLHQVTEPRYWVNHVRQPVRFAESMVNLHQSGCDVFLEIGPNPTLISMGQHCLPEGAGVWLPSLRQGSDEWQTMLSSLSKLYTLGADVDWESFAGDTPHRKVVLPTYPFQRERFWVKKASRPRGAARQEHPLLGASFDHAGITETIYESQVGLEDLPFLADHRIHGRLILPSPACMEMMLAAAEMYFGEGQPTLENFVIHEALVIPEEGHTRMQTVLTPEAEGVSIRVYYQRDAQWNLCASGQARLAAAQASDAETLSAIQARCGEEITVEACYEGLANLGLDLRESFQGVSAIWRADGEALCRMEIPDAISIQAADYRFFHPAFLDACFHPIGQALPNASARFLEAYLLLGLDRLNFTGRPPAAFWNHIKVRGDLSAVGARETFVADIELYTDDGRRFAELQGISLKRARSELLFRSMPEHWSDLLYQIAWRPQAHPAAFSSAGLLAAPKAIEEHLMPRVDALSAANQMPLYDEMLPLLDRVGGMYAARALQDLGLAFDPGDTSSEDNLAARLGIIPRQRALFARLLEMLAEDGLLRQAGAGWMVLKSPDLTGLDGQWERLQQQFPMFAAELTLIARCTRGLADALAGRADPLQLLFPGGSMADAEKLYQDAPVARTYNTLVREAVTEALKALPSESKIRILEIGAGTGSTTSYVLSALPAEKARYVFTDVSPMFTARAAEKFNEYDFVAYQTLDISRDPLAQGFEAGSFDLVIAANVLHATPDLRVTLQHVKTLLAPRGELVLYEAVGKQRFSDLTVGLTEGWWSFTDRQLRPEYALLSRDGWRSVLGEGGFTETVTVPGSDSTGILSQQVVIVARASAAPASEAPAAQDASIPWLILADGGGTAVKLAGALRGHGQHCEIAGPGEPVDFEALFQGKTYRGVIHLLALDNHLAEETTAPDLREAQRRSAGSVLRVAQAMVRNNQGGLWLVTRGAQALDGDDDPAAAGQAAVLGLARTAALEHPELHCKRIDLDPHAAQDEIEHLVNEILYRDEREEEVAYRIADGRAAANHSERRVRRLARIAAASAAPLAFSGDAAYLITGGLRGLGLLVAEWMAARGAKHLVLMGRSGPSQQAREVIARMEREGARVLAAQGDVSCEEDVVRVLAEAQRSMPPLRGIIHSAGVLDDGMLLQQDWARFETVMGPKVSGTWHLHALTRGLPLDFFVLFSSGVSLLGSAGQGNHAAANAFVDAFAAYRRSLGLPAASINWGAWSEVGAAADRNLAESRKVATFTPQQGLQALEWVMQSGAVQVGVLPADWNEVLRAYPLGEEPALFREIARQLRQRVVKAQPKAAESSLSKQLAETVPNKRKTLLLDHIRGKAAQVLNITNASSIDPYQPLQSLGLDSLMAVELRNILAQSVEKTLPVTLLFEYPTIAALADTLAEALSLVDAAAQPTNEPANAEQAQGAELDGLSDDELADLLQAKLGRILPE